jgi:hypothetical protein
LSDLEEKKFDTRSLSEGEPAGADAAGGGGAAAVWELAGTEPVVTGEPILLLPEQPAASSAAISTAAIGRRLLQLRSLHFISRKSRGIPNPSLSACAWSDPQDRAKTPGRPRPRSTAIPRILYQANRGQPKAAFCAKSAFG